MAEDGKLEKIKEQYIDEILGIVPLSQAVFIVMMSLVSERIINGTSTSVLSAMAAFGLKSSLGPEGGRFWEVNLLSIFVSFGLALLNMFLLRFALDFSLRRARLGAFLIDWQRDAARRVFALTDVQKNAIHASFKSEIETRLKKYKIKRISTELVSSMTSMFCYATVLLIFCFSGSGRSLQWSLLESSFLITSVLLSIFLHRSSLRYAIAKVLPLKVYLGVITGELVFFEEISN